MSLLPYSVSIRTKTPLTNGLTNAIELLSGSIQSNSKSIATALDLIERHNKKKSENLNLNPNDD